MMKDILQAKFLKEMCQTTANMYRLGWDERNGGNISYLLDEKEVAEYLDLSTVIREIPIGFEAKDTNLCCRELDGLPDGVVDDVRELARGHLRPVCPVGGCPERVVGDGALVRRLRWQITEGGDALL